MDPLLPTDPLLMPVTYRDRDPRLPQISGFETAPRGAPRNYMSSGPKVSAPQYGNENLQPTPRGGMSERAGVLSKLLAARDFRPQVRDGKMYFRSLTPAENEIMQRIGWARAPDVEYADEISQDPLVALRAWERNIRHWHSLASPE
jgi:hypothetical protein